MSLPFYLHHAGILFVQGRHGIENNPNLAKHVHDLLPQFLHACPLLYAQFNEVNISGCSSSTVAAALCLLLLDPPLLIQDLDQPLLHTIHNGQVNL
jgi:hypothetical protein